MAKRTILALGAVGTLAAAWSGGWYYGQGEIREGVNAEIARLAQQGIAARYQSVDIGGFPFTYHGKIVAPQTEAISRFGTVDARTHWRAPWIAFETSVGDLGVINFVLPETQTVRLTPVRGGPIADITIRSNQFEGSLRRELSGARITGEGRDVEITAESDALINHVEFKADSISIDSSAPMNEPGPIVATASLSGLTANEGLWGFFDPSGSFPRDPANIKLHANADTTIRADNSLELKSIQIENLAIDIAGVSVNGQGQAIVQNRQPDGTLTLRFSGLADLLNNAAKAGFLPPQQAANYSAMIGGFAKKGTAEGQQVFDLAFKGGYIFVNGLPTFIPAPLLP